MGWGVRETAGKLRLALGNAEELSPGIPVRKAGRGEGEVKARSGQSGAEGLDAGQATDTALRGARGRIQRPGANTPLAGGDLRFQDKAWFSCPLTLAASPTRLQCRRRSHEAERSQGVCSMPEDTAETLTTTQALFAQSTRDIPSGSQRGKTKPFLTPVTEM